ncbi:MAG TPA: MDR family MFS transporter [Turneriella sp.]|nr:MDR family MFS transporter [Turneriella sp.]
MKESSSTSEQRSTEKNPPLHRAWILLALMVTMMLAAMDTTIISTAIPQIVEDLGGFAYFSWVYSIYLLAQTVTIPIYGKLADLYGRKPVLLFGTSLFLVGSAACASAWNMASLIAFRGLQGLGAGSILATVNTLAGDIFTVEERAKIQGWLSSVWGMAAILGPSLGGAFVEYASWQWIFLINLPIGIVSLLLIAIFLHESFEKRTHTIDYAGAFFILVTGVLLLVSLMQIGNAWPLFSYQSMGLIFALVVLFLLTLRIESGASEPIMPTWVWKNKTLIAANLAMVCMGIIMIGPNMYIPIFSQSVLRLDAIASGFVLASMSLGWPLASSLSGKLYLKIDFRNTAMIGTVLIFAASGGFLLLPFDAPAWLLIFDQALMGAGFGLLSTPTLVGVQSIVSWSERGVVTGANMFSRYLGQSIGAAILGGFFNSAMRRELAISPTSLQEQLPHKINDVVGVLKNSSSTQAVTDYLRHAFYLASHHVFSVMAFVAVLIFLFLCLMPRKLKIVAAAQGS